MIAVMKDVVGSHHLAVKMGKNRKNRPDVTLVVKQPCFSYSFSFDCVLPHFLYGNWQLSL